jgi:P27 family predicted phage terminase small subunit
MRGKAPSKLSPDARKLWRSLSEELDLDASGRLMLEVLVQNYDRRLEARAAIAKNGAVVKDRWQQDRRSPWIEIERDATLALQRAYHALGLDLEPNEQ